MIQTRERKVPGWTYIVKAIVAKPELILVLALNVWYSLTVTR